jgi:pyruvate dehydrogenase E2 component (dihydrolipoamide acetyltransferase)
METVTVPDIGDFTDVPVVEVHVKAGDAVAVEDPLITLESDKATMDVPAPVAGIVKELLVGMDDKVSMGTAIAHIEPEGGEGAGGADAAGEAAGSGADEPAEGVVAATLAEDGAPGASGDAAQEPDPQGSDPSPPAAEGQGSDPSDGAPVYASPVARRMARGMGVDLATVQGTGHNGRITKDDVQAAAAGAQVPGTGATPAAAPAAPAAPPAPAQGDQTVELTRIQLASARNLSASWQTIPHVTHHDEADITELEAFRKQLNAEQSDVKVTMVALLLKACAAALREFPRFASQLHEDRLVLKGDLHLGFAADTPNGLVVPVIRDVDRKGVLELAGELTELSGKARAGKLSPREMSGAVFTISSLGGIGGTAFTPIVNSPQVAILGVVRSQTKPVWDGTAFVPRLMLPLSLSYDHRVIDGAAAARFCVHLGRLLTDLRRALL